MANGLVSLTDPCQSCRRVPTASFRFRSNTGFIVLRQVQSFQGILCRVCARRVFRDMQARNLTLGWWGFVSFFGTIVFLVDNRSALRHGVGALKPPLPADPRNDPKLAGRPVFARPSVLLVLALLVVVVLGFVTDGFGIDRDQWEVGACVDYSGTNVIVVPCEDPLAEGRVLAIIEDLFSCPPEADYFVDLNSVEVACLG